MCHNARNLAWGRAMRTTMVTTLVLALGLVACGGSGGDTADAGVDVRAEVLDVAADVSPDPGSDAVEAAPDVVPGTCGSHLYAFQTLVPGPGQAGYDADLDALATRYERVFHTFNAAATGLNTDVSVPLTDPADHAAIEHFARETDGWDFAATAGRNRIPWWAACWSATAAWSPRASTVDAARPTPRRWRWAGRAARPGARRRT